MTLLKKFLINGLILTLTSIFMRVVSVVFNVYITHKIGSVGMGLFQLILSIYTFGVTFATSGINLAATRLVSEELVTGSAKGISRAMRKCILYSLIFGLSAFFILYFFSNEIALHILGDIRTLKSLKILAVSLPFLSLSSALCGYFSAMRRVYKNALTSVLEQFIKIFLTVVLLVLLSGGGIENATVSVVLGMCLSEIASFLISLVLYIHDVKKHTKTLTAPPSSNLTMRLLKMSVPVALSAYIRSGLVTLEQILIPKGLIKNGATGDEALSSYGIISGMVFPIIFFPLAFLSAFSSLVIPEMTKYKKEGDQKHINYVSSRVFQLTLLFSVMIAGIFIFYSDSLGLAIYDSKEAGNYIKIFAALVPVMYLDNSVDCILKGLGEQVASMRYNILDAFVSVLLVHFLLPPFGIQGYVIVVFISELLNASLSINKLLKITNFKIEFYKSVLAPIIAIIGATTISKLLFYFLNISYTYNLTGIIVNIMICIVLYTVILELIGGVSSEDKKWFASIFKRKTKRKSTTF